MKTIKNLTLLMGLCAAVLLAVGCDKETEEYKSLHRDTIIGQWKLMESYVSINHSQSDITVTDYSKENIIFDFQENNKLVVTGHIPDVFVVFDDFQEGEYFYEYSKYPPPPTDPGPNLFIDKPEYGIGERWYFCTTLLGKETMDIVIGNNIGGAIVGSDYYRWGFTFFKLN